MIEDLNLVLLPAGCSFVISRDGKAYLSVSEHYERAVPEGNEDGLAPCDLLSFLHTQGLISTGVYKRAVNQLNLCRV